MSRIVLDHVESPSDQPCRVHIGDGYAGRIVVQGISPRALVDALRGAGHQVIIDGAGQPPRDDGHSNAPGCDLSARELDILRLIAMGQSNQDIARQTFLSINTVKSYVRTAYREIGVTTRNQAVLWALQHGLVT